MSDVCRRIALARTRFGKLRHLWHHNQLHFNLRMRLYKACVCSILTYGSEAWRLDAAVMRKINGANAQMMSAITGRSVHQEASAKWRKFDLVKWIRARRLQWLGHILRLGPERKIKQAVFEMYKDPQDGDLLMDAPKTNSWRELGKYAADRDYWKARVRQMKQPRVVTVDIGEHHEDGQTLAFTTS